MSENLATTYNPKEIEPKLYKKWCENKYFHAEVDRSRKPFTTVMPPPNITGKLHMGHALDNTMQDILIRYKRMQGYNALWVPGTDHAAISTEVKVTNQLKDEGIDKKELGREKFLERTWQWKEEYAPRIPDEPLQPRFVVDLHQMEYIEYLLDTVFINGTRETKIAFFKSHEGMLRSLEQKLKWEGVANAYRSGAGAFAAGEHRPVIIEGGLRPAAAA